MGYPTGPIHCENDSACTPLVKTFLEPGFLCLYSYLGFVMLSCSSFFVWRNFRKNKDWKGKRPKQINKSYPQSTDNSLNIEGGDFVIKEKNKVTEKNKTPNEYEINNYDLDEQEEENKPGTNGMYLKCYRENAAGNVCYYYVISISLLWPTLLLVILIDFYHNCQFNGIDSLCFFGDFPIFGTFERNANVFYIVWVSSTLWYGMWMKFRNKIRNWFRIPCRLKDAQYVWVWVEDKEERIVPKAYKITKLYRKVKGFFQKEILGHSTTIEIKKDKRIVMTSSGFVEKNSNYFIHEGIRYIILENGKFERPSISIGESYSDFHSLKNGLTYSTAQERYSYLGPNEIHFIPDSMMKLITNEFFSWFYLYQWIMYIVWFWFSYLFVAVVESTVVLISAFTSIAITYKNQNRISKLSINTEQVQVLRDSQWAVIDSIYLVPGDIISIKHQWKLPCDIVLLNGSVVVNESGLTGESNPIQKIACPNEKKKYENKSGSRYTLFSGTYVLQTQATEGVYHNYDAVPATEHHVVGVVIATGINTGKGSLVSSILYPQKMVFKYDEELSVVVCFLLLYGFVVFILAIFFQYHSGIQGHWVLKWCYGVFTISQILTPLLPVALKVGQIRSSQRLNDYGILTVNPARIAISGKIRCFCFDKTGTLTKEGLDFLGVQPVLEGTFHPNLVLPNFESETKLDEKIIRGLASCHTLANFGDHYVGNTVEVQMFQSTGWCLFDKKENPKVCKPDGTDCLHIIRRFEFNHSLQTMSVIVKDQENQLYIYCKGSFEKIKQACSPNTLPRNYSEKAEQHASNGGYTLGIGFKKLENFQGDINDLTRADIEYGLEFLGLLVFHNELKNDTPIAMYNLAQGAVHTIMVTGDNAQCAHYVGKSCRLIKKKQSVLLADTVQGNRVFWKYVGHGNEVNNEGNDLPGVMTTEEIISIHKLEGVTDFADDQSEIVLIINGSVTLDILLQGGFMKTLIFYTRIFSRMCPDSKVIVIKMLQSMGVIVGMCGDGGNDCGALRAAHAGIALNNAEASIVSPFTCTKKSCLSAFELVREGRAALHTSFSVYKFLIIYGQLFSLIKMVSFYYGVLMSLIGYIFVDVVAVLTFGITMTLSKPHKVLRKTRPTSSLIGPKTVLSAVGVQFINICTMVVMLLFVTNAKGYVKWPAQYADAKYWWYLSDNWESTALYFVMYFNFTTTALIFSFGGYFRRFVLQNIQLVLNYIILVVLTLLLLVLDPNVYTKAWHVSSFQYNKVNTDNIVWREYQKNGGKTSPAMSTELRVQMLLISLIAICVLCIYQGIVIEGPAGRYIARKYFTKTKKFHPIESNC